MEADRKWEYDVKCRRCGKVTRMFHSNFAQTSSNEFRAWACEHSTFPIARECDCDKKMIMFHDLVSFMATPLSEIG